MKFIYKKKINQKKTIYKQKKTLKNIKIPTLFVFLLFFPYPSFTPSFSPLAFDISCKI